MKISVYTLSVVKLKGLRKYIRESSIFTKFFSLSFIQDGIRRWIEVEAEHEAQEELKIDLKDLEDEFILGVQLCFRRFPIDGFSGKWWSK